MYGHKLGDTMYSATVTELAVLQKMLHILCVSDSNTWLSNISQYGVRLLAHHQFGINTESENYLGRIVQNADDNLGNHYLAEFYVHYWGRDTDGNVILASKTRTIRDMVSNTEFTVVIVLQMIKVTIDGQNIPNSTKSTEIEDWDLTITSEVDLQAAYSDPLLSSSDRLFFKPAFIDSDTNNQDDRRNFYIGTAGFREYKNVLQDNGIIDPFILDNLMGIPLEEDFGSTAIDKYLEEGLDADGTSQSIIMDKDTLGHFYWDEDNIPPRWPKYVIHPTIGSEIMSSVISTHNYITTITLGILEDRGFLVNYNADNVTNTGTNLNILIDSPMFLVNATLDEANSKYKLEGDDRTEHLDFWDGENPTIHINVGDRLILTHIPTSQKPHFHYMYIHHTLSTGETTDANHLVTDGSVSYQMHVVNGSNVPYAAYFTPTTPGTYYYQGVHSFNSGYVDAGIVRHGEIIVSPALEPEPEPEPEP